MDGRVYRTTADDRAKKKPRGRAPALIFSSDSEDSDFLPAHQNLGNKSHRSSLIMQSTPVRDFSPIQCRSPGKQKTTMIDNDLPDFERCTACKQPFGYEEVMVCGYCSESFFATALTCHRL